MVLLLKLTRTGSGRFISMFLLRLLQTWLVFQFASGALPSCRTRSEAGAARLSSGIATKTPTAARRENIAVYEISRSLVLPMTILDEKGDSFKSCRLDIGVDVGQSIRFGL
jgi:hypothetical protein